MNEFKVAVSTSNNVEINELLGIVGSEPDSEALNEAFFPNVREDYTRTATDEKRFATLFKNLIRNFPVDRTASRSLMDYSELKIAIPIKSGVQLLPKKEIIYLEATGNYTKVFRSGGKELLVSKTMKLFEPALKETFFVRVHRKYIVNVLEITAFLKSNGGELEMSNGDCISISKKQQESIQAALEQISSFV